jgi:hypothetical protein
LEIEEHCNLSISSIVLEGIEYIAKYCSIPVNNSSIRKTLTALKIALKAACLIPFSPPKIFLSDYLYEAIRKTLQSFGKITE